MERKLLSLDGALEPIETPAEPSVKPKLIPIYKTQSVEVATVDGIEIIERPILIGFMEEKV